MRKIVLASTSPWKKELLAKTGLKFTVAASDYEEDMTLKMSPRELAKFLSRGKAEAVARSHKNSIVIGADTFIVYGGKFLGKPHTPEKAIAMLAMLSGKKHSVITGFTIIDTKTGKRISQSVETIVHFRKLSSEEIKAYVATGQPLKVAGSYAIQGLASLFVKKIDGDFYNVVGFPICEIAEAFKKFGVNALA